MPVIEVSNLTKEYRLGAMHSLKQTLANARTRLKGGQVHERPLFKALDNVSFTVDQGEVVGIIGHNGAGKSTLLKILSRISTPTSGTVRVRGRIAPLIEVGAGFVPDFTGRENVYLNGAILGMPRKEIDKKFDEIVDFAEMADFIDTPVKRYSSGMQVKLAFAVATSIESEVLIVDEVLAVGDLAFQRKCYDRVEQFVRRKDRTILLVSHNLRQVERLCSRTLLLKSGQIEMDGPPIAVCNEFFEQSNKKIATTRSAALGRYEATPEFELMSVTLLSDDGESGSVVTRGAALIEVRFALKTVLHDLNFTLGVHTTDLFFIGVTGSDKRLSVRELSPGEHVVRCRLRDLPLVPGAYAIHFGVESGHTNARIFRGDNLMSFQVKASERAENSASDRLGVVALQAEWLIPESFAPAS